MKKYAFKEFDSVNRYGSDNKDLYAAFQEFAEQGYRYHSWLPGIPDVSHGSYLSTILIFEKDIEDVSDDDF